MSAVEYEEVRLLSSGHIKIIDLINELGGELGREVGTLSDEMIVPCSVVFAASPEAAAKIEATPAWSR